MVFCIIAKHFRSNDRPTTDETPINMFIHLSTKEKIIDRNIVKRLNCPECGHVQHSIFAVVKTFRIFWIPFFGVFKKYITCLSCEKTMAVKDIKSRERRDQANVFPIKITDYLKVFLLEIIVICIVIVTIPGLIYPHFGSLVLLYFNVKEKAAYKSVPYSLSENCTQINTGDHFLIDMSKYDPVKFKNETYKIGFINGSIHPNVYNLQTGQYETKSSYRLSFSAREFDNAADAIFSLQSRQNFKSDYLSKDNSPYIALSDLSDICKRSFKRIILSLPEFQANISPPP